MWECGNADTCSKTLALEPPDILDSCDQFLHIVRFCFAGSAGFARTAAVVAEEKLATVNSFTRDTHQVEAPFLGQSLAILFVNICISFLETEAEP